MRVRFDAEGNTFASAGPSSSSRKPCRFPGRLLIVDEDVSRASATAAILMDLGMEVVCAQTEIDALVFSDEGGLAAVLIELRLSAIDGTSLAKAIRDARPRLPIVFLGDRTGENVRLPQIAGERIEMYVRPVAPDWLRSRIGEYVAQYRTELRLRKLQIDSRRAHGERARFAATLKRMERQRLLVNDALPLAFYCGAADGTDRRFVDGAIERVTGYDLSAFAAYAGLWEARIHPVDCERVLDAIAELSVGESITLEYRWRHAGGEYLYMLDHCSLLSEGENGEIAGIWLDISDRRTLEIERNHTSKLETVGRLTGGIAHDFGNMLAVTISSLERLQSMIAQKEEAWARTQDALHAARDCADLTRQLVHLARRDALQVSMIDLREHLPIMLDLVKRSIGQRIEVELDMPDDLPSVSVVRSQLDSAVLNLALNARDAMPDGGKLTVSLATHVADDGEQDLEHRSEMIELAVSDTGIGMQPEVLDKAFEPFFTTKNENGTGLGLSMIQEFVEGSGGEVKIESRRGEGTTVRLLLPSAP